MENLILTLLKNFENKTEDQRNRIVKLLGKLRNYLPEYRTGVYYQLKTDVKDLPHELIWEILLNLDYREILNFRLVSKWYDIIIRDDRFWQQKLYADYPAIVKYSRYFLYPEKYKYPKTLEFLIKPGSFKERYKILRKEMLPTSKLRYSDDLSEVKPLYLEQAKRGIKLEEMLKIPGVSDDKDLVFEIVKKNSVLFKIIDNRDVVLYIVSKDYSFIISTTDKFRDDKGVVLTAIRQRGWALEYASDRLKNDEDVVMEAIKQRTISFYYAGDIIKNNKDLVLEVIKRNGHMLKYASNTFKNDKEVVLEAIKNISQSLEYASDRLKNDKEVVLEAVKEDGRALKFASDNLKNDEEVVWSAVNAYGKSIRFIGRNLDVKFVQKILKIEGISQIRYLYMKYYYDDLDFVRWLVEQNKSLLAHTSNRVIKIFLKNDGMWLKHAGQPAKRDKELILVAVRENGLALQFAEYYRNDEEVARAALKSNILSFKYMSGGLGLKDINIVKFAIKLDPKILQHVTDEELIVKIVSENPKLYTYIDKRFAEDKGFILKLVKANNRLFFYLPNKWKRNKEVVVVYYTADPLAIIKSPQFDPRNLRFFKKLDAMKFISWDGRLLRYLHSDLRDDKDVVMLALSSELSVFRYASDRLKNDQDFILKVVKKYPRVYVYLPRELKSNYTVAVVAAERDPNMIFKIPRSMRKGVVETIRLREKRF